MSKPSFWLYGFVSPCSLSLKKPDKSPVFLFIAGTSVMPHNHFPKEQLYV